MRAYGQERIILLSSSLPACSAMLQHQKLQTMLHRDVDGHGVVKVESRRGEQREPSVQAGGMSMQERSRRSASVFAGGGGGEDLRSQGTERRAATLNYAHSQALTALAA